MSIWKRNPTTSWFNKVLATSTLQVERGSIGEEPFLSPIVQLMNFFCMCVDSTIFEQIIISIVVPGGVHYLYLLCLRNHVHMVYTLET